MVDDIKQKLNRRTLMKASGVAGMATLAGCISASDDDNGGGDGDEDAYSIGMIDSLTGSLSAFGERNQRGADLALERVNELGINDRELEIIVEDSGSENQGGISAAQKLVNQDSVPFLIGAVGSGVSIAIYESVVQDTDVVQLSQNSTGLNLTDFPGLLRMSPSGRAQSLALADIIADDGYDSVAVTYVNNEFGQSLFDAFEGAWDGEMAYESSHDQEQSSYSSVMSEMNNSGADAWLFITYQAEFATMVNEAFSSGYEAQFYGADSAQGSSVLEDTPEGSMEGMKDHAAVGPNRAGKLPEFRRSVRRRVRRVADLVVGLRLRLCHERRAGDPGRRRLFRVGSPGDGPRGLTTRGPRGIHVRRRPRDSRGGWRRLGCRLPGRQWPH